MDLLFVQDGEDYMELGQLEHSLTKLTVHDRGLVLILVPPGNSFQRYDAYHPNGRDHERYLAFFLKELLPSIKEELTSKGKYIHKLGLLGDSLGGAVSLSLLCKEPSSFTTVLMQSAAFSEGNFSQLQSVKALEDVRIYQVVGKHEDEFISPITNQQLQILAHNRIMRNELEYKQGYVTYYEEDEHHLWDFWRRDLLRALNYFLQT